MGIDISIKKVLKDNFGKTKRSGGPVDVRIDTLGSGTRVTVMYDANNKKHGIVGIDDYVGNFKVQNSYGVAKVKLAHYYGATNKAIAPETASELIQKIFDLVTTKEIIKGALREVSYKGNLGIHELMVFYDKASQSDIKKLQALLSQNKVKPALDLMEKVLGYSLHKGG